MLEAYIDLSFFAVLLYLNLQPLCPGRFLFYCTFFPYPQVVTIDHILGAEYFACILPDGIYPEFRDGFVTMCMVCLQGAFCDLVWSDPDDIDGWAVSPRGAGWLFGAKVTNEVSILFVLHPVYRLNSLIKSSHYGISWSWSVQKSIDIFSW